MDRSIQLFITILLLCSGFTAQAQLPEGWEWQNPLPHGLTINDVVMIDEWWAIAGCENGYIMRSGDGGRRVNIGELVEGARR